VPSLPAPRGSAAQQGRTDCAVATQKRTNVHVIAALNVQIVELETVLAAHIKTHLDAPSATDSSASWTAAYATTRSMTNHLGTSRTRHLRTRDG
jgi:hypothetical protein